ncbi:MAG: CBS domain-containing protein [Acidobacteria bacterium]|nr:MAG: CBS domain-containing protein [Acidobacteriota bacterium]
MHNLESPVSEFIGERHPEPVSVADTVARAAEVLRQNNAGCVLVADDGVLRGIFTERDFMKRVVAPGLSCSDTKVGEVMTPDPESLLKIDEVAWAINKMAVGGYRNIPVVEAEGKPLGVVGAFEVIDFLDEILEDTLAARGADGDDAGEDQWHDVGGG